MVLGFRSGRHRVFEKVNRASNGDESIGPNDVGTVSLAEIRRRLSR